MNSVHEFQADMPFEVVVSNFTAKPKFLPKGKVVAYASRSPVSLVHVDGEAAR